MVMIYSLRIPKLYYFGNGTRKTKKRRASRAEIIDIPNDSHVFCKELVPRTQRIVRFLHVVRVRKGLLFASVFVAVLLAGLYYATAPRLYESKSRLYVLQMGSDLLQESMENQGGVRENMANYQGVLTSDLVLEEVLQKLPAKHRVDLKDVPRAKWIDALRKQLGVSAPRRTNLIDVRYRSRDPQTAAAIVNHVVNSYLKLMREIHKSTASEDVEFLTKKREKLDEETNAINAELLVLKRQPSI